MVGLDPNDLTHFQVWEVGAEHNPIIAASLTEGDPRMTPQAIVAQHVAYFETYAQDHPGVELGPDFPRWAWEASNVAEAEVRRREAAKDRQLEADGWVTLSAVRASKVEFIWKPYIARKRPTALVGDPGVGKTKLACYLAAHRSRLGEHVLLLSAEDDASSALRPFMEKHGANLDLVHLVPLEKMFVLDEDGLAKLDRALERWPISFAVIDPIVHFMGDKRDMNKQNEVRGALGPLAARAAKYNVALILNMHSNKSATKALYKTMGSQDFNAAVRSVLHVAKDDEDDTRGKAMFHVKVNDGKLGPPVGFDLLEDPADPFEQPTFAWRASTDLTLADLEGRTNERGRPPAQSKMAKGIIVGLLKNGPQDGALVKAALIGAGISESTWRRAVKSTVDIEQQASGLGGGSTSVWTLKPIESDRVAADDLVAEMNGRQDD
jgi:hypothetical protein